MNFLRTMDLYKAIILLSLILLPLGGWWVYDLEKSITASKRAIDDATRRPGGLLEEIGSLMRKIEVVVQNRRSTTESINDPGTYFEGQIFATVGSGLKANDFKLEAPREELATLPSRQRIADYVVDILWPRKELVVPLDFIYGVLFNCESGARDAARGGDSVDQQSIWKLRELEILNASAEAFMQGYKTPPPQLEDSWKIRKMAFARREPRKAS
jgi:hypothetical protein